MQIIPDQSKILKTAQDNFTFVLNILSGFSIHFT